jgi:uncharacterized alkaline shock family protein YloU
MTDTPTSGAQRADSSTSQGTVAQLETDRGTTSIDDSVVAKIAAIAAREVDGVAELGGTLSSALGGVVGRIRGQDHATAGVGVEVGTRQAAVDLTCKVQYPASIPDVANSLRQNVIDRIESMTGLDVVEVNVAVNDLVFPGDQQQEEDSGSTGRVE